MAKKAGDLAKVFLAAAGKVFTWRAYTRGAAPEDVPVTVAAPIITDGLTREGVQPLVDYVKAIRAHSNTEIAAAETERLQPYFSALSIYLTRALRNVDPKSKAWGQKAALKELVKPGNLSGLFNAMAAYTRNTIISDVVLIPDSIYKGPAKRLFPWLGRFDPTFKYGDRAFSFGFLQIYEGGKRKRRSRSSTTIPTFTLDSELMEAIAPHEPKELYKRLQLVLTGMNHDMLHHFHSPWIDSDIARKYIKDSRPDFYKWGDSTGGRVEEWSQISHGKIFMTPKNAALVKNTEENINRYFDELARIGAALPPDKAHEVVDYFGTVLMQTLSRTFPFNHDLMTLCLERMKDADPFDEKKLKTKALWKFWDMTNGQTRTLEEARAYVKGNDDLTNIVHGYRKQGCDILPDDDNAVSFQGLKLLQLARLERDDMRSHVPTPIDPTVKILRGISDERFLDMVAVVATNTGYKPK